MKSSTLFILATGLVVLMCSCDKKNEAKEQTSYDQLTFGAYLAETFKDSQSTTKYVQNSKAAHSLTLKGDGTLEVLYNATLGFISTSNPQKSFATIAEGESEAIKVASKKLSPKDSKETWDKVEKETRDRVAKDLAPISCSLKIAGKNLAAQKALGVQSFNEKGQLTKMDFEVVEVVGVPYVTTAKIPAEFHKKHCEGEKFVSYFKNMPQDFQDMISDSKYFTYNWVEIAPDTESFLKSKKGTLTFNSMSANKLTYSSLVLEKK